MNVVAPGGAERQPSRQHVAPTEQPDLLGALAPHVRPPAKPPAPVDRRPPKDPLDRLLATPADHTVTDNLPEFVDGDDCEAFLFGYIARLDGSGPVEDLRGSTLECWSYVRRTLAIAWDGCPRNQRPLVCTVALPPLDRDRRLRIAAAAALWPWEGAQ